MLFTEFFYKFQQHIEICEECKEGLRHTNIKDPQADKVNTLNDCLGIIKFVIGFYS